MTDFDDLADLAVHTRKTLHWAGFMLLAMGLILVIDLQLKRSVARQAVQAAKLFSSFIAEEGARRGQGPLAAPADNGDHAGRGRGDAVDGDARLAAGDDPPPDPLADAVARHPSSPRKRSPRDGGRTVRPDNGS